MQVDNTEFLKLQGSIGKELTCENCDCKYYIIGRRCWVTYKGTLSEGFSSDPIDISIFNNPYICRHFWGASSYALKYREDQFLKVFTCKNKTPKCTKRNTDWAPCYQCNNYEEIK